MIRRPPRSTLDRSSAASDVYKRQVQGGAEFLDCIGVAAAGRLQQPAQMVEEASVARGPGDGAQQTHAVDHAFGVRSVTGGDPRRERLRQRPDTRRRSHTLDEWEPSNRVEQRGGGDWTTPLQFNLRLEDARRMRPARFSLEIGKAPQDARGVQRAIEPPLFAQAYREQPVCVELAQPPSGRLVGLYVEPVSYTHLRAHETP